MLNTKIPIGMIDGIGSLSYSLNAGLDFSKETFLDLTYTTISNTNNNILHPII